MPNQPAAIFVRLYYKNLELSARVDRFNYTNLEQQSDVCNITLNFENLKDIPGDGAFDEKAEYKVVYGFEGQEQAIKKIYLRQKNWKYEKQISVNLLFTDKAAEMISSGTRTTYKNTNIIGIAKEMGDKHDLKVSVELPGEDATLNLSGVDREFKKLNPTKSQPPVKLPVIGEFKIEPNLTTYGKNIKDRDLMYDYTHSNPGASFLGVAFGTELDRRYLVDVDKVINKNYSGYSNISQAGQSDRSFINKIGLQDPNGPTIAYTTGDELIIKKRNFNQTPYKTYEYRGDAGEVLDFAPQYKTYAKSGPSNSVGYSGWDKYSKRFFSGNATSVNSGITEAIANYKRELSFLNTLNPDANLGTFLIKDGKLLYDESSKLKIRVVNPDNLRLSNPQSDNTNVILNSQIIRTLNVKTGIELINQKIDKAYREVKELNNPVVNNPIDAFNQASNNQINATLKQNPATLVVQFDPGLQVGKIITMVGTKEEHLGNYYIISCETDINRNGGISKLSLVRDGTAIKQKKAINISKFGKTPNTKVGPFKSSNTKIIK